MPAYHSAHATEFAASSPEEIIGALTNASRHDTTPQQVRAWREAIRILQAAVREAVRLLPEADKWGVLLEYPLLRLGRRLDAVVLAGSAVCVVEFKVGAEEADAVARRQVEDYSADLRFFHEPTQTLSVFPAVCE